MGKNLTVLVLGASGMLGHTILRFLSTGTDLSVVGSVRSEAAKALLPPSMHPLIISSVDVENADSLINLFARTQPDVVINCIGLVKQLAEADDPLAAIPINSLLPHRLAKLCEVRGARLIHISTDCVFAGTRGMYLETDASDAKDLYGRSKFLGEVDTARAVTLRTSIIGPELNSAHGLVGWFLSQGDRARGFTRAIFSGLPTVELARVIGHFVIPRADLRGLYQVSSDPISKYELLRLIAAAYGKSIDIEPDAALCVDRSLDSSRFRELTGYVPPAWPQLVRAMREFG
jgi:dTDP-4-dehydrorhamnose reductase